MSMERVTILMEHLKSMNVIDSICREVMGTLTSPIAWGPHRVALPKERAWLFIFDDSHDLYEVARSRGLSQRDASVKSNKVFRIFAASEFHAFQQFRAEFGDTINDRVMIFQMNYL